MIIIFCISAPLLLVRQRVSISQQLFANHSNQDGPHEKTLLQFGSFCCLFLLEAGEGEGGAGLDCLTSIKKFQVQFSQISFFHKLLQDEWILITLLYTVSFFHVSKHLMHRMLLALYIMIFLVMLQIWNCQGNGCLKEHFFQVLVKMSWVASRVSCWLGRWAHGAMDSWWD